MNETSSVSTGHNGYGQRSDFSGFPGRCDEQADVGLNRSLEASGRDRIFHYCTYDRIPDWLRCGWLIVMPNKEMHHHHYGLVLEWLCECTMVRPR
jgi:hypothetical protein